MSEKKPFEGVEVLLEGLDENSINSILNKWKELHEVKAKLDELEEMLRMKVRSFLKERRWDKYSDPESKISVSITTQKKESFDKEQLKIMLNEAQYAQVIKTTTFEKLSIITPESRERLKKYVLGKKN